MATNPVTERPLRADARRNRAAIVAAARAIVAEHGEEAQIQDVARRAGVGVGTVYRHFATKDALMGELVSLCARENAEVAAAALEVEDPWEAFAGMIQGSCEQMAADAAKRRVWNAASDEAFAQAAEAKREMGVACALVIDRARAARVLRDDFTIDDMPGLMCGLAAAIDAGPPGGWQRLAQFALDGLRAR